MFGTHTLHSKHFCHCCTLTCCSVHIVGTKDAKCTSKYVVFMPDMLIRVCSFRFCTVLLILLNSTPLKEKLSLRQYDVLHYAVYYIYLIYWCYQLHLCSVNYMKLRRMPQTICPLRATKVSTGILLLLPIWQEMECPTKASGVICLFISMLKLYPTRWNCCKIIIIFLPLI